MKIRKTTTGDLPAVMEIFHDARQFMRDNGNPDQWKTAHPPQFIIEKDIADGLSHVCVNDAGDILATFFFDKNPDKTYAKIDGKWLNDEPYGVVHRIARASIPQAKGAGAFCLNWSFEQIPNIRIDTHKDNTPMITLLERLGFKRCGIIWLENGDERVSFQAEGSGNGLRPL